LPNLLMRLTRLTSSLLPDLAWVCRGGGQHCHQKSSKPVDPPLQGRKVAVTVELYTMKIRQSRQYLQIQLKGSRCRTLCCLLQDQFHLLVRGGKTRSKRLPKAMPDVQQASKRAGARTNAFHPSSPSLKWSSKACLR